MNEEYDIERKTLRDYLNVIFRHKMVIVTSFCVVTSMVYLGLMLKTPVYESSVKILISADKQVEAAFHRELDNQNKIERTQTQSEIVKSTPVLERVVESFKVYKSPLYYEKKFASPIKAKLIDYKNKRIKDQLIYLPILNRDKIIKQKAIEKLKGNISVEPVKNTNIFVIKVIDFDPEEAALIANMVSRSYVIYDLEQQLAELSLKYGSRHPTVVQLNNNIERMIKNLTKDGISNLDAIGPASVKIIEQATYPQEAQGASKKLILMIASMMSIFLGLILAFVFDSLDMTLKTPKDVTKYLNIPLIGYISKKRFGWFTILRKNWERSLYGWSFQNLANQIYMLLQEQNVKTLLMTSSQEKEGTSTIASNIGIILSKIHNKKIIILDTNLEAPKIHKHFHLKNELGLSDVIKGNIEIQEGIKKCSENLYIMPRGNGTDNQISLLFSPNLKSIMLYLKENFDLILIDCANLRVTQNAEILSSLADGVILVVSEGRAQYPMIKEQLIPLISRNVNILGAIFNKRSFPIPNFFYKNS